MGLRGYDQWKTASPYDDDVDVIEKAEQALKSLEWARLNWDADPGPWFSHLNNLADAIKALLEYIEENI